MPCNLPSRLSSSDEPPNRTLFSCVHLTIDVSQKSSYAFVSVNVNVPAKQTVTIDDVAPQAEAPRQSRKQTKRKERKPMTRRLSRRQVLTTGAIVVGVAAASVASPLLFKEFQALTSTPHTAASGPLPWSAANRILANTVVPAFPNTNFVVRSEERRVGKEC